MSIRVSRIAPHSRPAAWLLPLLLCAGIFALSSQHHLNSGLGIYDLILRKIAHAAIFAALALSVANLGKVEMLRQLYCLIVAWTFTALYAASDEWHQSFVSGRTPAVHDVAIDIVGATCALVLWRRATRTKESA
jgi:VanZ family protein